MLQQFNLLTPQIKWRFRVVSVKFSYFGPEIGMQAAHFALSPVAHAIIT